MVSMWCLLRAYPKNREPSEGIADDFVFDCSFLTDLVSGNCIFQHFWAKPRKYP